MSRYVKKQYCEVINRARQNSSRLLENSGEVICRFLEERSIDASKICFAAVGSVGRREALEASDLDVIPIAADEPSLAAYVKHDGDLRASLSQKLRVKVSRGEDLTRATSIDSLTKTETIGGSEDERGALTRRVLLLTESAHAGGSYRIKEVRTRIIGAYANEDRTSGRHTLALCNDIARYFKTLCIEYKAKIEEEGKDWCTRNMKLRHSRKIWYFSCIMTTVYLANKHPTGQEDFVETLLAFLDKSPLERLATSLADTQPILVGRLFESYALFLEFMSKEENRAALSCVSHGDRYEMTLANQFPAMKFNSDLIHTEILNIIDELGPSSRQRIMGWFML